MSALQHNTNYHLLKSTLSVEEIRDRITETEKMIDSYLARITRLQMLINLEEARLLSSQKEYAELQTLIGSNDASSEGI